MRAKTSKKMNEIEKRLQRIRESRDRAELQKRIDEVQEYFKQVCEDYANGIEPEPMSEEDKQKIIQELQEVTGRKFAL